MRHKIVFLNKVVSEHKGNHTTTFTLASAGNGVVSSFTEFIKSIKGVTQVTSQEHLVGMGYWINVATKKEAFEYNDWTTDDLRFHSGD